MEIPLEYKIMVLKKMLEMHDTLAIHKRKRHPGLCNLYITSVRLLFGGDDYIYPKEAASREIYDDLIHSPFEDLDECTIRRRAVQDFEAVGFGLYWWNINQFSPRRDFLLNAIQTLEYKLEHNT